MSTQVSQLLLRREIRWIALSAAIVLGLAAYMVWTRPQAPQDIKAYRGTQLNMPSPDFRLQDHSGEPLALSELRGKVVVLTFFDSKCVDVCPMVSLYLREVDRTLGTDAEQVVFLAVNVNARSNSVDDVAAATEHWLLGELTNWHFLTGSPEELEPVWADYYIFANPTPGRQLVHTDGLFLIDPEGRQRWYISTPFVPYGQGELPPGTANITELLVSRIRELL